MLHHSMLFTCIQTHIYTYIKFSHMSTCIVGSQKTHLYLPFYLLFIYFFSLYSFVCSIRDCNVCACACAWVYVYIVCVIFFIWCWLVCCKILFISLHAFFCSFLSVCSNFVLQVLLLLLLHWFFVLTVLLRNIRRTAVVALCIADSVLAYTRVVGYMRMYTVNENQKKR